MVVLSNPFQGMESRRNLTEGSDHPVTNRLHKWSNYDTEYKRLNVGTINS